MTLFRIYYSRGGGHTTLRVFGELVRSLHPPTTLGNAGTLVLRNEEFEDLRAEMEHCEVRSLASMSPGARIEFVEENKAPLPW